MLILVLLYIVIVVILFRNFRVFGTAIVMSAVLNLFIPVSANVGPGMVIVIRIMQGLIEV